MADSAWVNMARLKEAFAPSIVRAERSNEILPQDAPPPIDLTLHGNQVADSPFQQNAEQKFQANMRASQAAQAQKLELEMQERAQMAHEMALERARRSAGR